MKTNEVEVNLNDHARVKLTPHGVEVYRKSMNFHPYSYYDVTKSLAPDADGYNKFMLWELMNIFGPELHNGVGVFEGNNIILKDFSI